MVRTSYTVGMMKRRVPGALVRLALAMALTIGMRATDAAAQTDQPTDPAAVVHAFNAALSRGDLDAALALLDPTCRKVVGPHSLNREEQTCGGGEGQFPGPQSGPPIQIAEANLRTTGPETAEVDMTLSGNTLPPTPHPITLHAYFTVKNGRITQLLDELSPQTEQELAALAPPPEPPAVMPNTGSREPGTGWVMLVLGVSCALVGAAVRRSTAARGRGRSPS